jgi:sulfur-oxidizing protein SoxZ
MRIKAKLKSGVVTVKALAKHPMIGHTEAKKKKVKVNFITHLSAKVGGKVVYELSSSQFISKNPYFKFKFKGASAGNEIVITWKDSSGKEKVSKAKIK